MQTNILFKARPHKVGVYADYPLCYRGLQMEPDNFPEVLDLIHREDSRFDKNAYHFVRQALDYTLNEQAGGKDRTDRRHVTGMELLDGIREYALDRFGPLAMTVFSEWNIRRCEDFGEIVFQLVEYGVLGKTENDRKSDFAGGYDFEDAFLMPFLPKKKRRTLQREKGRANKEQGNHAN
jgi:uncharacterized repeat protein (TIGR04138 family)